MSQETAASLLRQAGFKGIVVDKEKVIFHYVDFFKILEDLKKMGESNALRARSKKYVSLKFFNKAAEIYNQVYGFKEQDKEILPLTIEIFYLTGWKEE